jgi:hypothetical protein
MTTKITTVIFILALIAQISSKKLKTKIQTTSISNILNQGSSITTGQYIISPSGVYSLQLQTDGNLVVYGCANTALWSTASFGETSTRTLKMQTDGNLVLYQGTRVIWASNTYLRGTAPYYLKMQDDGNLVIYDGKGTATWDTATYNQGTCSGNVITQKGSITSGQSIATSGREYRLVLQTDGNLVLYNCWDTALWASNTNNSTASRVLTMQEDGNLVMYQNNVAKWASGTNGKGYGPYYLIIQDNGNLVIYGRKTEGAIWATNTPGNNICDLSTPHAYIA